MNPRTRINKAMSRISRIKTAIWTIEEFTSTANGNVIRELEQAKQDAIEQMTLAVQSFLDSNG